MNRDRFLRQRGQEWRNFESLLSKLKGQRVGRWATSDVSELARMYRSICYDLSLVQSREWGVQLEQYLNDLVAQGHNCLYRSPPRSLQVILTFLIAGFPRLLRARKQVFFLSLALFLLPFVAAMVVAIVDPVAVEIVIESSLLKDAGESYSKEIYTDVDERYVQERSTMLGFYVNHNVGIAFQCFAFGIFLGVGTALVLISNGIVLGAVTGYVVSEGHAENFFSFVISHGSFELTAIVIAGASGLLLGRGILYPGDRTRLDSLVHHGKDAVLLILGAGVMLGIAALLEAFFSPMAIAPGIKFAVGSVLWLVVILYLTLAGRRGDNA